MPILNFLLKLYLIITGLLVLLYTPRILCWFWCRYRQPRLVAKENRRLAMLIPARNESAAIGSLLDSIQRQTYPGDCFDTFVIVAKDDDPTIEMAKRIGASVQVVQNQKRKGDALDACLKHILDESPTRYDAYIIVDADCVLDENFLTEMNNALESGAEIICAKKRVKNYFFGSRESQPLSACCNGLIWTLMDNMGNAAKTAHGLPCFVVGTGLMLRADIVRQNGGWPYRETVTEDVELQQDSVLKGWRSFYYQYAILYMEEAVSLRETNKRRRRWMTGVVDSTRAYAPRIAADPAARCRHREIYHIHNLKLVYLMMGLSTLFSFANTVFAAICCAFHSPFWFQAARNTVIGFLVIYGMFFIMTLFAIIADFENIRIPFYRKVFLLFMHPLFYMKYIPIVGVALFSNYGRTWDMVERVDFAEGREK